MKIAIGTGVVVAAAALLLAAVAPASAEYYFVNAEGTGDFPTIQAAVDASVDADVIMLNDGIYTGDGNRDIVIPSKAIAIMSVSDDPTACVIDCEGSARAERRGFHFTTTGGTGDAELYRIGMRNGYTETSGGGIWVEGASPMITGCVIRDCVADGEFAKGGGVYVSAGGSPGFVGCTIASNSAGYGAGVGVDAAGGLFHTSIITDNHTDGAQGVGGGAWLQPSSALQFDVCEITDNSARRAGGVRLIGADALFTYCNISRNEATAGNGGGIWFQGGEVSWCTFVGNSASGDGGGMYLDSGTGSLTRNLVAFTSIGTGVHTAEGHGPIPTCFDVYGNGDGNYSGSMGDLTGFNHNFSLDPKLCGYFTDDYRLMDTSPCGSGAVPCGQVGAFGVSCDSPVEETSWGRLKALWR